VRRGFWRWFSGLVAAAGAVSLRRNFGDAPGLLGLALGVIAPIVCAAAALAVLVLAVLPRRNAS
jgi:hypothetical protein